MEMKNCDELHDAIVLFEDLGASDRREVTAHVEKCAACRKKFEEYRAVMAAVVESTDAGHIDEPMLTRYGIYLSEPAEPDYDGRKLAADEISHIAEHVERCSSCRQKVDRTEQEYLEIEAYLEEAGVPSVDLGKVSARSRLGRWAVRLFELPSTVARTLMSIPAPKLYPAAVTVLATLLVAVWVSPLFRGSGYIYYELAAIEDEEITFVTRNGASAQMSDGLLDFSEGHYAQAREHLEGYISENPDDPNVAYAHYVSGVACLRAAKSDVLGRFVRFDTELLDRAVRHFQMAAQLSDNPRIDEDAYWFLAKAYLMKQEAGPALGAFREVSEMKGRRFRQSQEMVFELEQLTATPR